MSDSAALHPDLTIDSSNYYRECADLRDDIKAALGQALEIKHSLYLVSNTTQALITVISGLCLCGMALNTRSSLYLPYRGLKPSMEFDSKRYIDLITHVDPMTGNISKVDDYCLSGLAVVDAAQSFGTVRWHQEALKAGVFIAPLHKHCGVVTGLGLIGIHPSLAESPLHRLATVAEAGTMSLSVLREAMLRIERVGRQLFNRLALNVSSEFVREARVIAVEVLTPVDMGLPFVCFRGLDQAVARSVAADLGLTVKHFSDHNITRVSGAARGGASSPALDLGNALEAGLLRHLRN